MKSLRTVRPVAVWCALFLAASVLAENAAAGPVTQARRLNDGAVFTLDDGANAAALGLGVLAIQGTLPDPG